MDTVVVSLAGEFTQGEPLEPVAEEITLPAHVLDVDRDLVYRVKKKIPEARKGDYLILETRSRANTGELVVAAVNGHLYLGRFWAKHGRRELQDRTGKLILSGPQVVAVVIQIVRL